MRLLGDAAVAMWWNVADEYLTEFHEWHSKEHLPERLSIPGFNRGSRWQQEGSGEFFVLYELEAYETLTSPGYLARLNAPTPWSTKMMPLHRQMIRSQCRVIASDGGGVATFVRTVKLSPASGREKELETHILRLIADLPEQPGINGVHLLRTETPKAAPTEEQRIRGGDATADWIVIVCGHNSDAIAGVVDGDLGEAALSQHGVGSCQATQAYRLVHAVVSQDI